MFCFSDFQKENNALNMSNHTDMMEILIHLEEHATQMNLSEYDDNFYIESYGKSKFIVNVRTLSRNVVIINVDLQDSYKFCDLDYKWNLLLFFFRSNVPVKRYRF